MALKRSGPPKRRTPMPRPSAQLERTPLNRGVTALRRVRINPVSKKRRKDNVERRAVVEQLVKIRGPWCDLNDLAERNAPDDFPACVLLQFFQLCTGLADDAHEVLTRARGGSITDPDNILLVCRRHHDWITTHPKQAHELGLVRHSWESGRRSA